MPTIRDLWWRLIGRKQNTLPPYDFAKSPYRAKKLWPPPLMSLSEHRQFNFERRFKRRLLLKSIRPKWNKWVKVGQTVGIWSIVIYSVFFWEGIVPISSEPLPPRKEGEPMDLRDYEPFSVMRRHMRKFFEDTFGWEDPFGWKKMELKRGDRREIPEGSIEAAGDTPTSRTDGRP